ncbi:hypothetical protein [Desmospora activa]|uniref:Tetratricopeptide repeat protein n=1 Tax=Desmospora activa DSM 45169 TaxID=1121389 RepID=A0A2T4ZCM9_9BACL|nr:hypothetical protein [Desmospora activa]PTM59644.1 hypothetical protein C8J48_2273 [Desmospora activa DSM 45169]
MKKGLLFTAAVIGLVGLIYAWVWVEVYQTSQFYYEMATDNYRKGDYGAALKGVETENANGETAFLGGYQQVIDAWDQPYAWPRPSFVEDARGMVDQIINEKLTIAEGEALFQAYFNRDNRYLGRIMLRVGELYEQQQDVDAAIETYEVVRQAFANDDGLIKTASQRLSALKKQEENR